MGYCVKVLLRCAYLEDSSRSAEGTHMVSSSRRSAILVLSIILACGCVGVVFGQRLTSTATSGDGDIRDSLRSFTQGYEVVQQNYAEPVSPDKAIYNGAIPGMLRVLDPHSNFFDPKAY